MDSLTAPEAPTSAAKKTRRVVCISRILGAGGPEVGRRVAEDLGYLYLDEEILQRAAEAGGVTIEQLKDVSRRKSFLERLLHNLALSGGMDGYMLGIAAVALPPSAIPDPRRLRALIHQAIEETADEGNAVIVSHAASYALAGRRCVLRVLVTASRETREARAAAEEALCDRGAAKAVKEDDRGREAYLRDFYDIDDEDATHYDITLNSDTLSIEMMAQLVERAATAG
jgi:cytidylate kinase